MESVQNNLHLKSLFSKVNNNSLSLEVLNRTFDVTYEGLMLIDKALNIIEINTMGKHILNFIDNEYQNYNLKQLIINYKIIEEAIETNRHKFSVDSCFNINYNSIRCITNIMPVSLNNEVIGAVISLRDTSHIHKLVNNVVGYKASYTFDSIITKNQKMKSIIEFAKKASDSDCSILIDGNSGTGKELFSQAIHNHSMRKNGPFVAVNCAAIPRELVESELFGYEKGAFTGASKGGYPGKFELADGGTIFLDEIGELPLDIQSKLLRVLDNLKIIRVGGTYEKKVNIRVIAATNKDLGQEVINKNFRGDLYYRLNVINVHIIPLKERLEDIEELTHNFIDKLNRKNINSYKKPSEDFIEKLKSYPWPGNVRELRNVVERSYYICENDIITSKYLNKRIIIGEVPCCSGNHHHNKEVIPLSDLEHEAIENAIIFCRGNIIEASNLLGISRATIYRKINKYNIDVAKLLAK